MTKLYSLFRQKHLCFSWKLEFEFPTRFNLRIVNQSLFLIFTMGNQLGLEKDRLGLVRDQSGLED